jgi:hypothetical protein
LIEIDEGKKAMIFDPVKMRDALKVTFNNKLTSEEIAASSYQQACSQVATSLDASGSYGSDWFGKIEASVSAAYSKGGQTSKTASFAQFTRFAIFAAAQIKFPGLVDRGAARQFLSDDIRNEIDDLEDEGSIRRLFQEIGFFFPHTVRFGAMINFKSVYSSSSSSSCQSAVAQLSANYKSMAANVRGTGVYQMEGSSFDASSDVNIRISNYGGDILVLIEGGADNEKEWLASAAQNPVPVQASFYPTFLLAPPEKRELFERVWKGMSTSSTLTDEPSGEGSIRPGLYQFICDGVAMEAFPNEDLCRPRAPSNDRDQRFQIEVFGRSFKISCNTNNQGLRYIECWPNEDAVRPRPLSDDVYQLWFFEPMGNDYFSVRCYTRNQGLRALEAVREKDRFSIRNPTRNSNQLFRLQRL